VIVRVVPAGSLSTRELARWSEIQRTVPSLASPFFAPEFTSIVAAARDDVSVAVLEVDQRVEGFFPFQRGRLGMGLPVGSILSDYHGVVLPDQTNLDARALIRSCGLTTWEFHHVVDSQPAFAPFHRVHAESMQIDLDDGFEPYLQWVQRNHGHSITHLRRKTRKLEREHGTIRFTAHTDDPAVLATMLRWKSAQYTKTGAVDILKQHWIRDVLGLVHRTQSDGFAGLLSIISADEQPVAVHLGLRSGPVCHSWFPAYDPRFAAYSPGLILLLRLAESAPQAGITTIDLGSGGYEFKRTLTNRSVMTAAGAVELPSLAAAAARSRRLAKSLVRRTTIAPRIRRVARSLGGGSSSGETR